jgi:hypothetical protein
MMLGETHRKGGSPRNPPIGRATRATVFAWGTGSGFSLKWDYARAMAAANWFWANRSYRANRQTVSGPKKQQEKF